MTEQDFQKRLATIVSNIDDLPAAERSKIESLVEETRQRHAKMRACVGQLQESLDYLRLSVKYLVFDLEATRRENKYLRSLLAKQGDEDEAEGAD